MDSYKIKYVDVDMLGILQVSMPTNAYAAVRGWTPTPLQCIILHFYSLLR